jgi:hypothetical protein
VLQNHPLLRLKNSLPVKFVDLKTNACLKGPIFSSASPECMYGHFVGYNADTAQLVEGLPCEQCQIPVEHLQQNELLMMLRDNVFNPAHSDIFYCPEYNRFKLISKVPLEQEEGITEEKPAFRTEIEYLNYYHFRTNLRRMTTKLRVGFSPSQNEEVFSLSFRLLGRNLMITDPARGRYCQHFAFTDLRLYYLSYDP